MQRRRVVLDADPVERLVGPVEGHEVGDEGEVARVDGDAVRVKHVHNLAHEGAVGGLDAVVAFREWIETDDELALLVITLASDARL